MGVELCARSATAQKMYETASEILGYDLLRLCSEGPQEQLNRTEHAQPALFVHSMAVLRTLEEEEEQFWENVIGVAGLSLGEYTAVAAAGGLSFEDGVRLVQLRGRAMQAAADSVDSAMASILGLDASTVEAICNEVSSDECFAIPANYLCPGNIVISGHTAAVIEAQQRAEEAGAMKTVRLAVAGAFHTPLMQSAVSKLVRGLEAVEFHAPRVPVVSNVDAAPHLAPQEIRDLLARQVVEPVQWEECLRYLINQEPDEFLEIGAGRVLAGTLKRINRKAACRSIGG
ncbi:MAG: malonyl CoA-acyl carrier protein transacylase [Pirellulaceae bacterium]|nr:MAG: malonyl CoA-acyl carrier protein transacylase [Pirellulaceae bacterium]